MTTDPNYSPWQLLPAPEPCTVSPPADYFYEHVAKHLVKDTVRIMHNGLPIDLNRVIELEDTLDTLLADVAARIAANTYIQQYMQQRHATLIQDYIEDRTSHLRSVGSFIAPFVHNNAEHRSYFMYIYAEQQQITPPSELLPSGIPKWDARLVKKLSTSRPLLQRLLAGQLQTDHPIALQAMQLRAQHKADIYNRKFLAQIESPEVELPPFNVGSSTQKKQLFSMLGYESEVKSKDTGEDSWNRNQIERLLKETDDTCLKDLLTAMIDYSYGAIIKQNFVPAFYKYTVNGRLHGQYKLFGAKSFRYTSANPNMLNAPSTASIYAKPVKRCFVAPPGYIFYAIDLSALEDRVMASLSRDTNKCNIFLQDLDGHCLNAYGYFLDEIAQYMPITGDTAIDVKLFFKLQDEGHKELKAIRQKGKPATFGLSYGAYPPKVSATLKVPLSEAESIFNNYHNVLYPGITNYRENYVLPTATANGKLHLGLGCYLHTNDARKDIRTLSNASCQFWSIITTLTINRTHQLIDVENLANDISCVSTIYDSIYYLLRDDAATIKWLNDRVVPTITTDFMKNQTIHNAAAGEIGYDWASLKPIPNNATLDEINSTRQLLKA